MTKSPKPAPPASSAARDRARAGAPQPLNSAGRPVDSSGRPVRGPRRRQRPDASDDDARRSAGGEERRGPPGEDAAGRGPRSAEDSQRGDPEPTEWERIRRAGWAGERPGASGAPATGEAPSLSSLLALLDALRAIVPRELERQFTALLRELLLTVRALIDWYLERLESDESERRVEDIPIE